MDFSNKKNQTQEKPKEYWRIREWFPEISEETDKKLNKYYLSLQAVNKSLGLVSEKTLPMADVIHFADCILATRKIFASIKPSSVMDIGTGNGFPGMVIALLYPDVAVTILDKDPKRIEFLRSLATELSIKNIKFVEQGLDTIPAGSLDMVIVRAPTPMGKALLALRRHFKKGGVLFMMKSEEWASEVANLPSQLCTFWSPSLTAEYRLPIGEVKFAVVRFDKIAD